MSRIPKTSIKRLIKMRSQVRLTDKAAESISAILEAKARKIAAYASTQAKRKGRKTILKEDIDSYRLKFGD
ncbi:MAG TPA: histone-like protein [Candidatus Acidoferrum sp.]|nr:histone-like protein [Candidatus Acidoferrum sp.]